jgi:hypothetical protein
LDLIEPATAALNRKAEAHRERSRIAADLTPDRLAFDASVDGERLRRYELACGRAIACSLDEMLSLVTSPLPDTFGEWTATESIAPNEPNEACLNAAIEPTQVCPNGFTNIDVSPFSESVCAMKMVKLRRTRFRGDSWPFRGG